ncbi:MAG: ABC transporter ATP-binding protein [Candidatus Levybacteria bacterium]|nr:ABC transporter ATP-binding protein [Candidatus Levybacteria bacterium]
MKKREIIRLLNITKQYKTDVVTTHVLNGISFRVNKNDFIAIIGPSGSGKSTLMNIIGLLDSTTSGKYFLNGIDTSKFGEDELAELRNKTIGFVFQSFNLLPRATTLENVILPSIYAGVSRTQRLKKATEILKTLGLGDRLNNRPNQLSGGQQQRVAIARALMNDPELILADEPTGNLDTKSGQDVMKILKNLNRQGKTIILITHEAEIAKHAKIIVRITDGKILKN